MDFGSLGWPLGPNFWIFQKNDFQDFRFFRKSNFGFSMSFLMFWVLFSLVFDHFFDFFESILVFQKVDFWIYGSLTLNPRFEDFEFDNPRKLRVLKSLTLRANGFEIINPEGLGSGTLKIIKIVSNNDEKSLKLTPKMMKNH